MPALAQQNLVMGLLFGHMNLDAGQARHPMRRDDCQVRPRQSTSYFSIGAIAQRVVATIETV